jgi:hypothetical protein
MCKGIRDLKFCFSHADSLILSLPQTTVPLLMN